MLGGIWIILASVGVLSLLLLSLWMVFRVRAGNNQKAYADSDAAKWIQAAESIGMSVDPGKQGSLSPRMMRGALRGTGVRAVWRKRPEGQTETLIRAAVLPPMRLGLELMPAGGRDHHYVEGRFGAQDIQVGVPALDIPYVIRGIEVAGVQSLLGTPESHAVIQALTSNSGGVEWVLGDREVTAKLEGVLHEPQRLYALVDLTAFVASSLAHLRRRIPLVPWEMDIARAWHEVASRTGLGFDGEQICLHGVLGAMGFRVWIDRHEGTWCTGIEVVFEHPLRAHLQVFLSGELVGLAPLAGLDDMQTNHLEFDHDFRVQGIEAGAVRQVLKPEVLEKMMVERTRSLDLALESHRVIVMARGILSDPGILERRIYDVGQLARLCCGG